MRKRKKFPSGRLIIGLFTLITMTFLVQSCVMESEKPDGTFANNTYQFDLEDIIRRGKLVVLAENSSSSYFIYREKEMGFEYDILTEFAKEIGVELEIKIIENLDNVFEDLVEGKGDIISCNLTVNRERKKIIDYSNPILNINQVLVQRKSKNEEGSISNLLTEPAQLARKKVNVWSKSSYYDRLLNLQEEIGDTIYIKSEDGLVSAEELIELVAEGLIDYTVVEKNIAQINQRFFDNLDVSLSLSANQKIAFGLRQNNPILKAKFNNWFEKYSATPEYDFIYMKYFKLSRISSHGAKPQEKLLAGRLSMYDTFFKNAATKHGWDWRWLASLSYQESRFDPEALSFGGAYGMMQFMPWVGPAFDVYPDSPPEVQIMGGAKKLKKDYNSWKEIPNKLQRIKFALGSYNCGKGHILDAQRLAIKYDKDPLMWDDNVEELVLKLSRKEFYKDPEVRHGSMRGSITYKYVREIYSRFLQYSVMYK